LAQGRKNVGGDLIDYCVERNNEGRKEAESRKGSAVVEKKARRSKARLA